MLGKCPAMSDSLAERGSPDPEISPGQGGVFLLSLQVMCCCVFRHCSASACIIQLIQVGFNDKGANFGFLTGKNVCLWMLMHLKDVSMHIPICIYKSASESSWEMVKVYCSAESFEGHAFFYILTYSFIHDVVPFPIKFSKYPHICIYLSVSFYFYKNKSCMLFRVRLLIVMSFDRLHLYNLRV